MSKAQIIEILERNLQLFRDDDNFVAYFLDLTIYLLQYEYDWKDVALGEPPLPSPNGTSPSPAAEPAPARPAQTPPKAVKSHRISSEALEEALNSFNKTHRASAPKLHQDRNCPFCGSQVGEALVCPTCKHLTR